MCTPLKKRIFINIKISKDFIQWQSIKYKRIWFKNSTTQLLKKKLKKTWQKDLPWKINKKFTSAKVPSHFGTTKCIPPSTRSKENSMLILNSLPSATKWAALGGICITSSPALLSESTFWAAAICLFEKISRARLDSNSINILYSSFFVKRYRDFSIELRANVDVYPQIVWCIHARLVQVEQFNGVSWIFRNIRFEASIINLLTSSPIWIAILNVVYWSEILNI